MAAAYGKRPLWQWVLIYLVIGGVIYGLIYYFMFANKGGYNYSNTGSSTTPTYTSPPQTQQAPTQTNQAPGQPSYAY